MKWIITKKQCFDILFMSKLTLRHPHRYFASNKTILLFNQYYLGVYVETNIKLLTFKFKLGMNGWMLLMYLFYYYF